MNDRRSSATITFTEFGARKKSANSNIIRSKSPVTLPILNTSQQSTQASTPTQLTRNSSVSFDVKVGYESLPDINLPHSPRLPKDADGFSIKSKGSVKSDGKSGQDDSDNEIGDDISALGRTMSISRTLRFWSRKMAEEKDDEDELKVEKQGEGKRDETLLPPYDSTLFHFLVCYPLVRCPSVDISGLNVPLFVCCQ